MPGGGRGSFRSLVDFWMTRRPTNLGIRTLLIAEYDSLTSFVAETPVIGLGRVTTTVRRAIAGMELSTEFSVVRFESFSIKGARIVLGSLATSGARLSLR